jgi:prepilin-type N-terminal cleavage/methylation domain-containing protein/prepilin-type processing-associated H-X9-DG protein
MRKCFRAFTLMELLVVISIIGVLLSILIPATIKARDASRSMACRSNLKQMVTGITMFTVDNRQDLLPYRIDNSLWIDDLAAYLGNFDELKFCPSARAIWDTSIGFPEVVKWDENSTFSNTGSYDHAWRWEKVEGKINYGSYCLNGYMYSTVDKPQKFGKSLCIKYPAKTPFQSDGNWLDTWPLPSDSITNSINLKFGEHVPCMARLMLKRHGKKIGMSFMDGHVENVGLKELWQLNWNKDWTSPDMAAQDIINRIIDGA